jgi:hypothetical protein
MKLSVKYLPLINLDEASKEIARWLGKPDSDTETIIFNDIFETITVNACCLSPKVVCVLLPKSEEDCNYEYDIECEEFFKMVKSSAHLQWGDPFLVITE